MVLPGLAELERSAEDPGQPAYVLDLMLGWEGHLAGEVEHRVREDRVRVSDGDGQHRLEGRVRRPDRGSKNRVPCGFVQLSLGLRQLVETLAGDEDRVGFERGQRLCREAGAARADQRRVRGLGGLGQTAQHAHHGLALRRLGEDQVVGHVDGALHFVEPVDHTVALLAQVGHLDGQRG